MGTDARRTLLVTIAAAGVALAGAACSGGNGASETGEAARAEAPAAGEEADAGDDAPARLATAEFRVDGMTCGGCALATEMSVKKLEGVKSADAEYDEASGEGRCTVEYDPDAVTTDQIAAAIEDAGFRPHLETTADDG